ncbi:MAG: hypothetical protein FJ271_02210 [Planctomycetes bacterium]|nr:hypothetical protein [Planctomycetota bacterium]
MPDGLLIQPRRRQVAMHLSHGDVVFAQMKLAHAGHCDDDVEWVKSRRSNGEIMSRLCGLAMMLLAGCTAKAPHEGKSVAQLEAMLRDPDPARQVQGAYGLSRLGAEAQPALPALVERLQHGSVLVRDSAALALGKIGPDASDAVPALTAALKDAEWTVRRQAALALGQIGPAARAAREALTGLAADENARVREAALLALKALK